MRKNKCIAMILAGGRGERLGALTQHNSKPAICFGGGHRLIDFPLNNCRSSGIDTAGIMSQYFTADLNEYINYSYGGKSGRRGVHLLTSKSERGAYKGTADSVYRNFAFIDRYMPDYVLVLASDHVYRMDYSKMIEFHEKNGADVTVASIPVPTEEASGFGIINAGEDGRVLDFEEKPLMPKSNLASMGIYVFNCGLLKKYLYEDSFRSESNHDFGRDILPEMLPRCRFYTYQFDGYWRDVGTVDKLWEANMEYLSIFPDLQLPDNEQRIPHTVSQSPMTVFSSKSVIIHSVLAGGCSVSGRIGHSILGRGVTVGRGAEIINSIIMPDVYIGSNVKIHNTIVGSHAIIRDGVFIGKDRGTDFFVDRKVCAGDVSLISPWVEINESIEIRKNSHVVKENLTKYYSERERADYKTKTSDRGIVRSGTELKTTAQ